MPNKDTPITSGIDNKSVFKHIVCESITVKNDASESRIFLSAEHDSVSIRLYDEASTERVIVSTRHNGESCVKFLDRKCNSVFSIAMNSHGDVYEVSTTDIEGNVNFHSLPPRK